MAAITINRTYTGTVEIGPLVVDGAGGFQQVLTLVDAHGGRTNISLSCNSAGNWSDFNGAAIGAPPAALVALGTATLNYISKRDLALAAPGVQALFAAVS